MANTYINILLACKEHLERDFGVSSLKLFGSVARHQEHEDSDVDSGYLCGDGTRYVQTLCAESISGGHVAQACRCCPTAQGNECHVALRDRKRWGRCILRTGLLQRAFLITLKVLLCLSWSGLTVLHLATISLTHQQVWRNWMRCVCN